MKLPVAPALALASLKGNYMVMEAYSVMPRHSFPPLIPIVPYPQPHTLLWVSNLPQSTYTEPRLLHLDMGNMRHGAVLVECDGHVTIPPAIYIGSEPGGQHVAHSPLSEACIRIDTGFQTTLKHLHSAAVGTKHSPPACRERERESSPPLLPAGALADGGSRRLQRQRLTLDPSR